MKRTRLFALLALALALSPLLAACNATGAQPVTADDVVQKLRDTMKTVTSVQGTFDLSLTINKDGIRTLLAGFMPPPDPTNVKARDPLAKLPDSASATLKYWRQSPDKVRVEVDSASIPGATGATLVYDGQKVYALDAARNTVYTATPGKHIDKIPDEIKSLMSGLDLEKEIDKIIAASDIKLSGTEKVAGADAYKLDVTPKPDAATLLGLPKQYSMQAGVLIKDLHATLWVDQARSVPLKLTIDHPNIGSFTYEAKTLEINKTIDPSVFVLQVPAGATTVDLDEKAEQSQPKQVTLPEARAYAIAQGWKLLEPSFVPAESTLVGVTQMQKPLGGGIQLSYSSKSHDFSIMQANVGQHPDIMDKLVGLGDGYSGVNNPDAVKDVTVRGVTAKAFSPEGANWTSLIWQEQTTGLFVAIRGKLTLNEATQIAEGLK
jgi:outer membrane lipoprotein-sorting protein